MKLSVFNKTYELNAEVKDNSILMSLKINLINFYLHYNNNIFSYEIDGSFFTFDGQKNILYITDSQYLINGFFKINDNIGRFKYDLEKKKFIYNLQEINESTNYLRFKYHKKKESLDNCQDSNEKLIADTNSELLMNPPGIPYTQNQLDFIENEKQKLKKITKNLCKLTNIYSLKIQNMDRITIKLIDTVRSKDDENSISYVHDGIYLTIEPNFKFEVDFINSFHLNESMIKDFFNKYIVNKNKFSSIVIPTGSILLAEIKGMIDFPYALHQLKSKLMILRYVLKVETDIIGLLIFKGKPNEFKKHHEEKTQSLEIEFSTKIFIFIIEDEFNNVQPDLNLNFEDIFENYAKNLLESKDEKKLIFNNLKIILTNIIFSNMILHKNKNGN